MKTKDLVLVSLGPSTRDKYKLMAVFEFSEYTRGAWRPRKQTVHFGAAGASDYTLHRDPERKKRYLARHAAREDWTNPRTAGALSRWILWNKPSLAASIADFKHRFRLG